MIVDVETKTYCKMTAKEVYMFCKKCLCPIETVKLLKTHIPECSGLLTQEQSPTIIPHLQIQKLQEELRVERIKNVIAGKILYEKFDLKLEDIYAQPHHLDGLRGRTREAERESVLKSPTRKKDRFTHIKNIEKTTESAIEEKRYKIAIELDPVHTPDKQTLLKNIELEFSQLSKDNYQEVFKNMLRYRQNLLCVIDPVEYTDIIKSYFIRINEYLGKTIQLNTVKIRREVLKYFNTIESRLLELDNFYKLTPSYDDITWYNNSISRSKLSVAEFLPYNKYKVFQRMLNYTVFTSPIVEIVRRELLNETGFNNFIYLGIASPQSNKGGRVPQSISKENEKFSFYYLDNIDKKSRQWKIDCRLEEFTTDLIDNVLDYCCDMFRKYYAKIYGDNDYRENYWERHEFLIYDQQQLLQNILLLLNKCKLMKMLQNLISEEACYIPSENDTFNLRSDDKLQQKRLSEEGKIDCKNNIIYHLHKLFDDLDNTTPNDNLSAYASKYL
jgi:hypothetical protein